MRLVLTIVIVAALSGCAGDPELSPDEQIQEAVATGEGSDVPAWSNGQYWTYKMAAGDTEIGTSSLVVTGEAGGDYLVGTNDKQIAYFDERFDITFMGEVRKSDLAGSQNGDRVAMFDWPLVADKQWTTTWDGETLDMMANPMGGPGEFHVMGHRQSDGAVAVEYHYNPAVSWFEYIVFYDADNATEAFRMTLTDSGEVFTGTVYDYEILDVEQYTTDPTLKTHQFEKSWPDATELGLVWIAQCNGDTAGQIMMAMMEREEGPIHLPPIGSNPPHGTELDCSQGDVHHDAELATNNGETWAIDMGAFSPNGAGTLIIEPRIVTETVF